MILKIKHTCHINPHTHTPKYSEKILETQPSLHFHSLLSIFYRNRYTGTMNVIYHPRKSIHTMQQIFIFFLLYFTFLFYLPKRSIYLKFKSKFLSASFRNEGCHKFYFAGGVYWGDSRRTFFNNAIISPPFSTGRRCYEFYFQFLLIFVNEE